jgi:SAM-dependent methyltransferase
MGEEEDWERFWLEKNGPLLRLGRNWFNRLLIWPIILGNLSRGGTVLELGCGCASIYPFLKDYAGQYVGIDTSRIAVAAARKELAKHGKGNCGILLEDLATFRTEAKFDLVFSQGVIEHFDDYCWVARKHQEFVKNGGKAVVFFPVKKGPFEWWYALSMAVPALNATWPWGEQGFVDYEKDLRNGLIDLTHTYSEHFGIGVLVIEKNMLQ